MNWGNYILTIQKTGEEQKFAFHSPVEANQLDAVKKTFNLEELPSELEELYTQTNGVDELLQGHIIGQLIWSLERLMETNFFYRNDVENKEDYTSFHELLFFSDAGNGDLFGFVTLNGKFRSLDVFVWNHEDDSRTWVAPSLAVFIDGWVNGKIRV